jgi:hypothetical protein
MAQKNFAVILSILFLSLAAPFFCRAEDETASTTDYFEIPKGCGITISESTSGEDLACKPWQAGSQAPLGAASVASCMCMPECLVMPPNHYYYDDPVAKHKQTNTSGITLPVVLAWDNVEAWKAEDGKVKWAWPGVGGGNLELKSKYFGAQSYLLEIDNSKNQLNDPGSNGGIFRQILKTTEFNSAEAPAFPCFFNSDTTIKWRVRPCCKEDGSYCMPEENAGWWTFTTSSAPEPDWPRDPDWAGTNDAKNVSFKDIKLKWCHAAVSENKRPYNEKKEYALSYQMRVYSNENKIVLTGAQIPEKFANLARWLQKDVPTLVNPMACNYLEKQQNNTCKPEVINPIQANVMRNTDGHFYYWSHKENPNSDRALFTKNLTYFWQLRRCFNNQNAGDDSCAVNSEKGWGQLWKFTTKDETIDAPVAMAPENDLSYANSQNAKLAALPGRLQWSVPNGANSFAYDIQKITGNNSTSLISGERRTTASQLSFTKGTSNDESETQGIELELDTPYKWRAKSCWSSIPVGDVCDSAWSPWYYFRTTGRAPKTDSLKPMDAANNIAMPVNLQWEAVPGAKSYIVTLDDKEITVPTNQYSLDYPKIDQSKAYRWKVQTCADAASSQCGAESPTLSFMTAALGASANPINPAGTIKNTPLIYTFSWDPVPGAHYYKLLLNYTKKSDKETNGKCSDNPSENKKFDKIVETNSVAVKRSLDQLYCLGEYSWSVRACLDEACTNIGAEPTVWKFDFIAGGKEIKPGETILAVCGLDNDNPNTAWDDREECGIKHTLMTVEQTINLVLFKISMILLPLLVLATGAMFYTQFGGAELKQKVISWWKIIGIGYFLLFFAWILVGIILTLFGYHGVWWQI